MIFQIEQQIKDIFYKKNSKCFCTEQLFIKLNSFSFLALLFNDKFNMS